MSENVILHVGGQTVTGRQGPPLASGGPDRPPLVVAIHGGGFTSKYFDLAPYSLLEDASAAGIPSVALDRPGYGTSSPIGEGPRAIARNAEVLSAAIAQLWESYRDRSSGVVLIGHSIGSLSALYIASESPAWPLLGVSVTALGTGAPAIPEFWNDHGPEEWVETPGEYRASLMFGQPPTYAPGAPELCDTASLAVWWRELIESYTTWAEDVAGVSSRVTVPVQLRQGDADILWPQGQEALDRFAAAFTHAPSVDARLVTDSGHCIDFHLAGAAVRQEQLAFAIDCAERNTATAS